MGNENSRFSGRASRGIILNLVLAGGNEISEILAAVTTSRVSGLSIADTLTDHLKQFPINDPITVPN